MTSMQQEEAGGGQTVAPLVAIRPLAVHELGRLEPLWVALHEHHVRLSPRLAGMPARRADESWALRRAKYIRWANDSDAFALVAEAEGRVVGYAFVTLASGYSSWNGGERLAQLETLSVAPASRGQGAGERLLAAVRERLNAAGIERVALTALCANERAHRFYERHGFRPAEIVLVGATDVKERTP
jgi:ribosomal protein S18 acetylase RimI-like enzyme